MSPTLKLYVGRSTCASTAKATTNNARNYSQNHQDEASQPEIFEPAPGTGLQGIFNWRNHGGHREGSVRDFLVGVVH